MGTELIDKYGRLIWKYVHSFAFRFNGFKNTPLVQKDDLYQECVADMIDDFVNSGKSIDEYEYDAMRAFHTMHLYIKKCLPVHTNVRTDDYKKHMNAYSCTQNVDKVMSTAQACHEQHDIEFDMDCESIENALNDTQKKIFRHMYQGHPARVIVRNMDITVSGYRYHRKMIAKQYNKITRQQKLYKGAAIGWN